MSATELRAAVESAFRDFNADGIASSGNHEPVKSEIRYALGYLLASVLAGLANGSLLFATVAARDADTSQADGTLAFVYRNNDDPADPANGAYQWNDGDGIWEAAYWYFAIVENLAQPFVDLAQAWASQTAGEVDAVKFPGLLSAYAYAAQAQTERSTIETIVAGLGDIAVAAAKLAGITNFANIEFTPDVPFIGRIMFALTGENDKLVAGVDEFMRWVVTRLVVPRDGGIDMLHGLTVDAVESDWGVAVVGDNDKPIWGVNKVIGDVATGYAGYSSDIEAIKLDGHNQAFSRSLHSTKHNLSLSRLRASHITIFDDGQSHATGADGFPAITDDADLYSIGTSMQCKYTPDNISFTPFGSAVITPYTPYNMTTATFTLIDNTAIDGYGPDANNLRGEAYCVAAAAHMARQWRDQSTTAKKWFPFTAGIGSKSLEEMSKGASPEYYNIGLEYMDSLNGLAVAAGGSAELAAINQLQGENNYGGVSGTNDREDYAALLRTQYNNRVADAYARLAGQSGDPAMVLYQTSGAWARDAANLSIAMGQLDEAIAGNGIFMAGPIYPYTNKNGGHLDYNGYRWGGMLHGKVMAHVLLDRLCWRPLSMLWTHQRGKFVYCGFHVPKPPLVFDSPYVALTATDYPAKGFRVQDTYGFISIVGVEIIAPTVIRIECDRAPIGSSYVWLGDETIHGGNTCIRDSDPTLFEMDYTYTARACVDTDANIAALVDEPYPGYNWAVTERRPLGWSILP